MAPESEDTLELFCQVCNVLVEARIVATDGSAEPADPTLGGDPVDLPHNVTQYHFARCKKCGAPFLVQQDFYEVPGEFSAEQGERVLYPADRVFDQEGIPDSIRGAYRDAARSFSVGLYEPCVIMCRKALEGLATELGVSRGNLKKRLDRLREDGFIDQRLLDWAHELRLVGNDAAHEFRVQLGKEDARDSIEFLEALLLYVFVLAKRFEAFTERRQGRTGSA